MKKYIIVLACSINIFLGSCDESTHSVDWYQQHEAERKSMLKKCNNDPNFMMKDKNCQNASSADFRSFHFKKSLEKSWRIEDGKRK